MSGSRVGVECCGVSYEPPLEPPEICPNCGKPWGGDPPFVHRETGGFQHERGYVAWCSCGIGSPPKPTVAAARASLARHIETGESPS